MSKEEICPSRSMEELLMTWRIVSSLHYFGILCFSDAEDYRKTKNEVGERNRYNERERVYEELVKFMGAKNVPPKEKTLSYIGKVDNNHFPFQTGLTLIIG